MRALLCLETNFCKREGAQARWDKSCRNRCESHGYWAEHPTLSVPRASRWSIRAATSQISLGRKSGDTSEQTMRVPKHDREPGAARNVIAVANSRQLTKRFRFIEFDTGFPKQRQKFLVKCPFRMVFSLMLDVVGHNLDH